MRATFALSFLLPVMLMGASLARAKTLDPSHNACAVTSAQREQMRLPYEAFVREILRIRSTRYDDWRQPQEKKIVEPGLLQTGRTMFAASSQATIG